MKPRRYTKKVVVIGGGTGSHALLRGLKKFAGTLTISAIVTMADSGGSSGRLRDEFGILPVGDARMALTALARDHGVEDEILRKLFLYRFSKGEGLTGHTLGNLLLVALTDMLGSEAAAIHTASRVLAIAGEVIPVTEDKAHLVARYADETTIVGEHKIERARGKRHKAIPITKLSLVPRAQANPQAIRAIAHADLIVLGPGDFYTSILANCVVDGVGDALRHARAPLAYVANLMSRNGQTSGMGTREYLKELTRYIGRVPDYMLVNTAPLRDDLLARYAKEGDYPVMHNYRGRRCVVRSGDLLGSEDIRRQSGDVLRRSLIRHDPDKLARAIMRLV